MPDAADLMGNRSTRDPASLKPFLGLPVDDQSIQLSQPSDLGASLNLMTHPGLLGRFPALQAASDRTLMQERLQASLFGETNKLNWIENCTPGKAFFDSDALCLLQYGLIVRQGHDLTSMVVNARLFQNLADCTDYYQNNLAPLVESSRDRPEWSGLLTPAAVIANLSMVVSVFPLDGQLSTLIGATDLKAISLVLGAIYRNVTHQRIEVKSTRIELAHYGRFKRCVLRYWLTGQDTGTGESHTHLVYGKVDGENSNRSTVEATDALAALSQANHHLFKIPQIYAILPELKLVLMEAIPGDASFSRILKARVRGESNSHLDDPLLEEAIRMAARVAAVLHASGLQLGPQRTFNDDAQELRRKIAGVQGIIPEIGDRLSGWLDTITSTSALYPELPLRFSHGDFTYTQFIYNRGTTGLVDFDNLCQAEPALDLGQFLAYLRFNIRKEELPGQPFPAEAVDQLSSIFLSTYFENSHPWLIDEESLQARIAVYEMLSYIRLGIHSWQKLKGTRLHHVLALLKERMPCLIQAS